VGGSESVNIKALAAGRPMVPVPRGNACLDAHRPWVINSGLLSELGNLRGACSQ
jgi:hypothetical protein